MHSQVIKAAAVWICSIFIALVVGVSIAEGDYQILFFSVAAVAIGFGVVRRDYNFLLALGLVSPFSLPLPGISGMPLLVPMLALCMATMAFERALVKRKTFGSIRNMAKPLLVVLALTVALRFGLSPVLPNLSGTGDSVTGFRGYLNYALCFLLLVVLGFAIKTRDDVYKLFKAIAGVSAFFMIFLIPLTFAKNDSLVAILNYFGLFVAYFDNGWLRFVVLPGFGITLIALCLLPSIAPAWVLRHKRSILVVSSGAVIIGGGRSSLVIAILTVSVLLLLKKRLLAFAGFVASILVIALTANFLANNLLERGKGLMFMRVLAIFNSRVAEATDADANLAWRMARWDLATSQIVERPWLGRGYGGLENAFLWGDREQMNAAAVEIDVASGTVHNGYIASAWAFGIPFVVSFVALVTLILYRSSVCQSRLAAVDPFLADVNRLVVAILFPQLFGIYFGSDLNNPLIWFPIGLSLIAARLGSSASPPLLTRSLVSPSL